MYSPRNLQQISVYDILMLDMLINADIWSDKPEILSADYGFDGSIGVDPDTEQNIKSLGLSWSNVTCSDGSSKVLTRATSVDALSIVFGSSDIRLGDGYPVVFSYPVLTSTASPSDFEVVLNTGEVVIPEGIGISPNMDLNERSTIVMTSPHFGNRIHPARSQSRFPVEVRIVDDGTPLMLLGPEGPVSAVGLSKVANRNPYMVGPIFMKAKLSMMDDVFIGDNPPTREFIFVDFST